MKTPYATAFDEAQGNADWDVLLIVNGIPKFRRLHELLMPSERDGPFQLPTEKTLELVRQLLTGERPVEVLDPEGHELMLPRGFHRDCWFDRATRRLWAFFDDQRQGKAYRYPEIALQALAAVEIPSDPREGDDEPRYPYKRGELAQVACQALADHYRKLRKRHDDLRPAAIEIADWMDPPANFHTVEKYIRPVWNELSKSKRKPQKN